MKAETRETLWALLGLVGFILLGLSLVWVFWPSDASAAACTPDLTNYTPTPTIRGQQSSPGFTVGYRVYWKHPEDASWQGSMSLPAFPGDETADAVWPIVSIDWPIQRLIPTAEQNVLVDVMVKAYNAQNVESAPSTILRICMPEVWTGGAYR